MTWAAQMCTLVSLLDTSGTNPGLSDWGWYTETSSPGLLSVYFLMGPDFFPISRFSLLAVTSMHDAQIDTSYLRPRNSFGRTPSFTSLNMDLGCMWDHLLCQYLNSYCKGEITSGKMMFSICSCARFFDSLI